MVRSCGDAGVWTLGYIKFMFDFKNYIIKIMSKYPSRHPVTLQGKLKLTKKKYLHILKFLLYFSIFPLYQLLADFSGWFRMKCKSLTTFDIMVHIQIVFLSSFSLGRGCSPAATPPQPQTWVRLWLCFNIVWIFWWWRVMTSIKSELALPEPYPCLYKRIVQLGRHVSGLSQVEFAGRPSM